MIWVYPCVTETYGVSETPPAIINGLYTRRFLSLILSYWFDLRRHQPNRHSSWRFNTASFATEPQGTTYLLHYFEFLVQQCIITDILREDQKCLRHHNTRIPSNHLLHQKLVFMNSPVDFVFLPSLRVYNSLLR